MLMLKIFYWLFMLCIQYLIGVGLLLVCISLVLMCMLWLFGSGFLFFRWKFGLFWMLSRVELQCCIRLLVIVLVNSLMLVLEVSWVCGFSIRCVVQLWLKVWFSLLLMQLCRLVGLLLNLLWCCCSVVRMCVLVLIIILLVWFCVVVVVGVVVWVWVRNGVVISSVEVSRVGISFIFMVVVLLQVFVCYCWVFEWCCYWCCY